MAQNEMRAMRGMPLRVRSMEGLGTCLSNTLHYRLEFDAAALGFVTRLAMGASCREHSAARRNMDVTLGAKAAAICFESAVPRALAAASSMLANSNGVIEMYQSCCAEVLKSFTNPAVSSIAQSFEFQATDPGEISVPTSP